MEALSTKVLQIGLSFDMDYILERRDDQKLPVDTFFEALKEKHAFVQIIRSGLSDCVFNVQGNLRALDWKDEAVKLLQNMGVDSKMVEITVLELEERQPESSPQQEMEEEDERQEENEQPEQATPASRLPKSLRDRFGSGSETEQATEAEAEKPAAECIEELIGSHALKALASEITKIAPVIRKAGTSASFASQSYADGL